MPHQRASTQHPPVLSHPPMSANTCWDGAAPVNPDRSDGDESKIVFRGSPWPPVPVLDTSSRSGKFNKSNEGQRLLSEWEQPAKGKWNLWHTDHFQTRRSCDFRTGAQSRHRPQFTWHNILLLQQHRHFLQVLFFPWDTPLDKGPGDRQRAEGPLARRRNREDWLWHSRLNFKGPLKYQSLETSASPRPSVYWEDCGLSTVKKTALTSVIRYKQFVKGITHGCLR